MLGRITRHALLVVALLACLPALLPKVANASAGTKAGVTPESYVYRLAWSPKARTLAGAGDFSVVNRGSEPTTEVWLRLRSNHGHRPARISKVSGADVVGVRAGGSMLRLRLDTALSPSRRARVRFHFELVVSRENTSLGRSLGVDLFGDALPVVAISGPQGIRQGPEPAYGEGSFNPVAAWDVSLRVPSGLEVVLPGRESITRAQRTRTYASRSEVRDVAFAIGRLRRASRFVGGTQITAFGSEAARFELSGVLDRAARAFARLQRWYGGYRLPSLNVVVGNLPFGGSEYPGVVFSTADVATVSHEVAHQWFYGLVGNDQYEQPWLDESLTAFTEQRFHREYQCNMSDPLNGSTHGLGVGMAYWQIHPKQYQATIYRGGACALLRLQSDIGVATLDGALRSYVNANAGGIATTDDFLTAVRAAAPWYDLNAWERLVGLP